MGLSDSCPSGGIYRATSGRKSRKPVCVFVSDGATVTCSLANRLPALMRYMPVSASSNRWYTSKWWSGQAQVSIMRYNSMRLENGQTLDPPYTPRQRHGYH